MEGSGIPAQSKSPDKFVKHTRLRLLPIIAIVFAAALGLWAASPIDADRRKAEYVFLEAANAYEDRRFDDYFYLLRRASALAPEDTFIAAKIAEMQFQMPSDSITRQRSYEAIKARFYADPTVGSYAKSFANIAHSFGNIDDVIDIWETLDSLEPQRTDPAFNLSAALLTKYHRTLDTTYYNKALAILDRLESITGPNTQIAYSKISAFLLRKDTTAILSSLENLRNAAPADIDAQLLIGNVFEHLSMPDSALAGYNRAAKIDPENGMVYLARAEFFRNSGDSVAYDREVFRALESQELPFREKFELLTGYVRKLYTDTTQWQRINQMFATIEQINPGEADLHDFYASYKSSIGREAEAAEQLSYSIDLNPSDPRRWSDLAMIYFRLEDNEKAEETSRKALALFPEQGTFQYLLATALLIREAPEEALVVLEHIDTLRLSNKNLESSLHATKGDLLSKFDRTEEAQKEYKIAVNANPDNYMAMNNWAYFNAVKGVDLNASELYASIACAAEPWNETYLDTYAWVLFMKKDYEKAREMIDKALAVFGIVPEGKTPEEINPAVATGTQKDEEPKSPSFEILDHAGDIYYFCHLPEEALKFWQRALELDPDNELVAKKVKEGTHFFE